MSVPATAGALPLATDVEPDSASSANATSCALWNRSAGFFFEAVPDDAIERGRLRNLRRDKIRRILAQNGRHRLRRGVAAECALTGDHLVEDCAERKQIRPCVDGLAAHLFRRHVADRADHRAGVSHRRLRQRGAGRRAAVGDPEIEDSS